MGLINSNGPAFAHYSDNFGPLAADNVTGFGVAITAGTSSADGAPVTLLPSLSHDCEYLWLGLSGIGNSGGANAALMDVLVDPAGGTDWSELISDLLVGFSGNVTYNSNGQGIPVEYHFPVWIPAGASVGARIRMANASAPTGTRVMAVAAGGNRNPASWWCGQKVETVGDMVPGSSLGQIVTPGASGAYSDWVDLGSPIAARAGAAQWAAGSVLGNSSVAVTFDYQFGAGGSQIGPRVYRAMSSTEVAVTLFRGPIFCDIPSGTQLQVRGAASGVLAGAQTELDCVAYLVQ